jgi:hypothetical protein
MDKGLLRAESSSEVTNEGWATWPASRRSFFKLRTTYYKIEANLSVVSYTGEQVFTIKIEGTNLSTETITQLLHLQSVFQMIDNNISNWIHVCRVMTGRPLRQVNFASIKRFRAQRIALEEIGNHGYVTLRGEVVCHKLDVLVDRTKDIADYEDCVAIRTSGMSEICWY